MTTLSKEQSSSREKTLLTALLLSTPGPLLTGLAAISSNSTTQWADFIRRSVELVALILSWWVFHRIQRDKALSNADRARQEQVVGLSVAGTMVFSGIILSALAVSRLSMFEPGGTLLPGLTIAALGLVANGWFWRRYTVLTREQFNAVIAAQVKLYRAKASVDLCVVTALAAVAVAPSHPATRYVDLLGSIAVAGYLLWSGFRMVQSNQGDAREN